MQKIKRNKKLDGLLTDIKSQCIHEQKYTSDGILEGIMAAYKKYETKNYVVTSAEADNIISALKSMPGFSMENFMMIPNVVAVGSELSDIRVFVKVLWIAYYMLSITNPELFEDYEEKPFFNPDGNYASEFIKRKLKEEKPND